MSCDQAIHIRELGKCYQIYEKPRDRLLQMLFRGGRQYYREFWALQDVSFDLLKGETIGIVGRNGAGKSTLLQLICGTLSPSVGTLQVNGRVSALLELGAGFNPEFSGRENVYLNAAVLGLTSEEIDARYDDIVAFSGIGDFIDQPVKTYSSGMYIRLAFSVATSVDPEILVVDEALSVGDGEFARKSFDRIMALRERGVTTLFCSHSMYHIEALCNRACWLEKGRMVMLDDAAHVVTAFNASMAASSAAVFDSLGGSAIGAGENAASASGTARLEKIEAWVDGVSGRQLSARSGESELVIRVSFASDPSLPSPAVAIAIIHAKAGYVIASVGSSFDRVVPDRSANGTGCAELVYSALPLLKGEYVISVFLSCERMLHIYDYAERYLELSVRQQGLEQGIVSLPHTWRNVVPDNSSLIQESRVDGV